MEVYVAFQAYRACQPYTVRHVKMSSALRHKRIDGSSECLGIEVYSVAYSTEIGKIHAVWGNHRTGYFYHFKRQIVIEFIIANQAAFRLATAAQKK